MTVNETKKIVREYLARKGMNNKLSARTIDFQDLARTDMIFVTVHDWQGSVEDWKNLKFIATSKGFRIQ